MPGQTLKSRTFVAAPMGDKSATKLAGIGKALGRRLAQAGYRKAYHVLGWYLLADRNKEHFIKTLKEVCGASTKNASECFNCLDMWSEQFL